MKYLNEKDIITIHWFEIEKYGGSQGIRDIRLIESAIHRPMASFANQEQFPTIEEKATVLLESLIKNHAFVDGNKRTAVTSVIVFLKANSCQLKTPKDDLFNLAIDISKNEIEREEIIKFIKTHIS